MTRTNASANRAAPNPSGQLDAWGWIDYSVPSPFSRWRWRIFVNRFLICLLAIVAPLGAQSEPYACPNTAVTVDAGSPEAGKEVCDLVARASTQLASCSLEITRPLTITLADSLSDDCYGQFFCEDDLIKVLSPQALAAAVSDDSIYQALPDDTFFFGILVHELAHAATDDMPCPFESCLLGQEYISYAMMMQSFPDDQRTMLIQDRFQRQIYRDELSLMILAMAPEVFAQKAWLHFSQRPDPCGFVGQIVDGTVLLDTEHF